MEGGLKAEARESLTRLSGIKGDGPQVRCCPLEMEYDECQIDKVLNPIINQHTESNRLYKPYMYIIYRETETGRERERK